MKILSKYNFQNDYAVMSYADHDKKYSKCIVLLPESVHDEIKIDIIKAVINKYSLQEIEKMLLK